MLAREKVEGEERWGEGGSLVGGHHIYTSPSVNIRRRREEQPCYPERRRVSRWPNQALLPTPLFRPNLAAPCCATMLLIPKGCQQDSAQSATERCSPTLVEDKWTSTSKSNYKGITSSRILRGQPGPPRFNSSWARSLDQSRSREQGGRALCSIGARNGTVRRRAARPTFNDNKVVTKHHIDSSTQNKSIGSPSPPKPCLQAPRDTSRPRAQPCSRFLTKFVSFISTGISLAGPQTCASNRLSVPLVLDISSGENALHTRISGSRLCYHITFGIGLELPLYQCRSWVVTDCVK